MYNKQGLMNLGNTCFINSTIQCLNNLKPFKEYLIKNYYNKGGLVGKFTKLLQALNNNSYKGHYIQDFIDSFYSSNNLFKRYEQDDSHIFLVTLLNLMNKEMANYSSKDSIIRQLFGHEIETITRDNYTGQVDEDSEPSFCISLPIQNKYGKVYSSLEECLKEYQNPKQIMDSYTRKSYTEQTIIKPSGKFLVINLQRVSNGRHIRNNIKYPEFLSLDNSLYELMGLIKHIGDEYSGHKVALCKDSMIWYEFNDYSVTQLTDKIPNESLVFLLFYQKLEDNSTNPSNYNQINSKVTTTSTTVYDSKDVNKYTNIVIEQYKLYEKEKKQNEDKIKSFFKEFSKKTNMKNETEFLNLKPSKTITEWDFQQIYNIGDVPNAFLEKNGIINYFDLIYSYKKYVVENSKTRSSKSYNRYKKSS